MWKDWGEFVLSHSDIPLHKVQLQCACVFVLNVEIAQRVYPH